jgi:pilus assembly protein Flp/PilA
LLNGGANGPQGDPFIVAKGSGPVWDLLRQGDRLTTNLHDFLALFGDTAACPAQGHKKRSAMFATLTKLLRSEDGTTAIEYAFVASLVSIVAVFVITSIGNSVSAHFESVANAL